jgi:two-component system invasion response regulator UvrY
MERISGPLERITVLLVDDHPVVRDGCRRLLENTPDIRVTAEAGDGETACVLYAKLAPDVVILDMGMPGFGGFETIRRLKTADPAAHILIFSMHDDETMILRAIEAGATGYLTKSGGIGQMVDAVRKVAQGKTYIEAERATELVGRTIAGIAGGPLAVLSPREFQLFQRFAEGQSTLQIAAALSISPKTVAVHHASIMKKLDLENTVQLVRLAIRCNVIEI